MIKSPGLEIAWEKFVCQVILVGTVYQSFPLKHRQVLQDTVVPTVLEIKLLAANDTPLSSSKTICSIFATSCWELKSKEVTLMLDKLCFKAEWQWSFTLWYFLSFKYLVSIFCFKCDRFLHFDMIPAVVLLIISFFFSF